MVRSGISSSVRRQMTGLLVVLFGRDEECARMTSDAVRDAIDVGDVDGLREVLRRDRGVVTALVAASGIERHRV